MSNSLSARPYLVVLVAVLLTLSAGWLLHDALNKPKQEKATPEAAASTSETSAPSETTQPASGDGNSQSP